MGRGGAQGPAEARAVPKRLISRLILRPRSARRHARPRQRLAAAMPRACRSLRTTGRGGSPGDRAFPMQTPLSLPSDRRHAPARRQIAGPRVLSNAGAASCAVDTASSDSWAIRQDLGQWDRGVIWRAYWAFGY